MSSPDAPKIKVTCAACGKAYMVKAELAGRSAKCVCGAQLKIPSLAKASPSAGATTSGDAASQSTIVTSISASSKDTVASKKPAPAKPKAGPPTPQPPCSGANEPVTIAPAGDVDDEFELEPAIVPPKIAPVAVFDDDVTLQPVAAITEPTTATATDKDEEGSKPAAKKDEGSTSTALHFLGICGVVIMGMSALVGLLNIAGAIYMVTRPNVSISASLVVLGVVAFQSLIYFVLFRLGQGLLRCERASLQGLVILYVIGLGAAACGMAAGYFLAGAIVMAALSVFMLPPVIVGFMARSDLYGEDD